MAAVFIPDTVAESYLSTQRTLSQLVRTGIVKNLPLDSGSDAGALFKAEAVLPDIYSAHPYYTNFLLRRRIVRPWSARVARVYLYYDNSLILQDGTTWIIRDATLLVNYRTDLIPGSRIPIRTGAYTTTNGYKVPGENVPMTLLRPLRQMTATRSGQGVVPSSLGYMVGSVNDGTYYGYPAGYWLCTNYESDHSIYSGKWAITATITSRVSEDWSETGILFNKMTQKKVPVNNTDLSSMLSPTYSYGIIYQDKGMVRVGPYPANSFSVFG